MLRTLVLMLACSFSAVPQPPGEVQTSGCPTPTTAESRGSTPGPDDYVELQRGRCFGSCPVYTIRVYRDGRVTWSGKQFVKAAGERTGSMAPEAASALIDKFGASGFWSLCGSYARMVTDLSGTLTTVHLGNAEKSLSDYASAAPDWFRELNVAIEKLAGTYGWIIMAG